MNASPAQAGHGRGRCEAPGVVPHTVGIIRETVSRSRRITLEGHWARDRSARDHGPTIPRHPRRPPRRASRRKPGGAEPSLQLGTRKRSKRIVRLGSSRCHQVSAAARSVTILRRRGSPATTGRVSGIPTYVTWTSQGRRVFGLRACGRRGGTDSSTTPHKQSTVHGGRPRAAAHLGQLDDRVGKRAEQRLRRDPLLRPGTEDERCQHIEAGASASRRSGGREFMKAAGLRGAGGRDN